MDTRDQDEYVRRHELARFESEMEIMNANLNATLEGMRADIAGFFAAAAERELKREKETAERELNREKEAAARELRYQQDMAKFQAEMAKFRTDMAGHRTDMAKRETRLIWALVGGFALLGTVLGILIRLPVS